MWELWCFLDLQFSEVSSGVLEWNEFLGWTTTENQRKMKQFIKHQKDPRETQQECKQSWNSASKWNVKLLYDRLSGNVTVVFWIAAPLLLFMYRGWCVVGLGPLLRLFCIQIEQLGMYHLVFFLYYFLCLVYVCVRSDEMVLVEYSCGLTFASNVSENFVKLRVAFELLYSSMHLDW